MDINGKKIVITGASSGIGKETLKKLAHYDAEIIAVGRDVSKIPIVNKRVIPFSCDVSQKEEVDRLFQYAQEKMGGIDLFIANAGFAYCEEVNSADWGHIENIFDVNVLSPIYSFEKMKELNRGRPYTVVMTCSAVAHIPLPGYALYCSTKAAVDHFAHTYAFEKNDQGKLILAYPIATATKFFKRAGSGAPVPYPVQPAGWVALCIVAAIRMGWSVVHPSPLFALSYFVLNRVFPLLYGLYDWVNGIRFRAWIAKSRRE